MIPARVWRAFGLLGLLLASLTASGSLAAEEARVPPTLVLFAADPSDPLLARIAAELRSQGFEIVTLRHSQTGASIARMIQIADRHEAVAAVRVLLLKAEIEVWIVDRVRNQTITGRVAASTDRETTRAVAALRIVELLRTNLMDLASIVKRPPAGGLAPATLQQADKPTKERDPRVLGLAFGAAAATSPGGTSPSWHLLAALQYPLELELGAELWVSAPIGGARVEGNEGSVRLDFWLAAAGLRWQPVSTAYWTPDLALGAAALLIQVEGAAKADFVGQRVRHLAASPYLRVGFRVPLFAALALRCDLIGGVVLPRVVMLFSERRAGVWGQPLMLASTSLQWTP